MRDLAGREALTARHQARFNLALRWYAFGKRLTRGSLGMLGRMVSVGVMVVLVGPWYVSQFPHLETEAQAHPIQPPPLDLGLDFGLPRLPTTQYVLHDIPMLILTFVLGLTLAAMAATCISLVIQETGGLLVRLFSKWAQRRGIELAAPPVERCP